MLGLSRGLHSGLLDLALKMDALDLGLGSLGEGLLRERAGRR